MNFLKRFEFQTDNWFTNIGISLIVIPTILIENDKNDFYIGIGWLFFGIGVNYSKK